MHLLLALDRVFYPGFRREEVRRPIFIVGHPRSGTTFLQLLLTQTGEFCTFKAWEIFVPSLTARALLRRVIERRVQTGQATYFPPEVGHEVALDQVEEDELLLMYTGNTAMMTSITPLGFGDRDFTDLVWADEQPAAMGRRTLEFLRGCLQRQIYATGKSQVIAKFTYSGMRLRGLLQAFPDARIVYIIRSPLETIPSHLTLERNLFGQMWGLDRIPRERLARYYQRRYANSIAYYRYVEDLLASGTVPPGQVMVLRYDALREDPVSSLESIAAFTGVALSDELRVRILERSRKQGRYRAQHTNLPLEEFGLTEERVRRDLAFVFEKYGFAGHAGSVPAP